MTRTTRGAARRSAQRLGWGLADQALSSLSNFAVGIVVARVVSPRDFGIFAIAFSLYTLVVSVQRSIGTDALVVRFSGVSGRTAEDAARRATGTTLCIGVVASLALMVVAPVFDATTSHLVLALAVSMPGLVLQDAWRNVFFARGRIVHAFLNDAVWTVSVVPAFALVFAFVHPTAAWLTLAWGASATVAAVVGAFQARLIPRPSGARQWLRDNRTLWPRYLGEAALFTGTQQVYLFVIGILGGLVALGQIRLIQIALGPVNVVAQGVGLVAVPEAVRALKRGIKRVDALVLAVSAVIAGGAACWGLVLGLAPTSWTSLIVGHAWLAASALLVPLVLFQVVNGANTGAFVGLRAFAAARRSLSVRAVTSVAQLAGAVIGVAVAGARGAAYGLFIASVGYLILWWAAYVAERGKRTEVNAACVPPSSARTSAPGEVASLVDARERGD